MGLRVAGRIAGQQLAARANAAAGAAAAQPAAGPVIQGRDASQAVGEAAKVAGAATRNVARGVGGFLRPFGKVGRNILLEVAGAFFLLFVLAAGIALWRFKPSHLQGPYDKNFFAAAAIVTVFLYLSASSFWRARRK